LKIRSELALKLCDFVKTSFKSRHIFNLIFHELKIANKKNNYNTCTTNLEKKHYMQDRVNQENDQTTMNCTSCSNASLKMIASDVDMLQENSDARLQRSCNDEEKIADIIDLLIKTSMLKKEMSKDYL